MKKIINLKYNNGFTLVELVVSVTILASVILIAAEIFQVAVKNQTTGNLDQVTQDTVHYALEVMTQEVHGAQVNSGLCTDIITGHIFYGSSTLVKFRNANDECVTYEFINASSSNTGLGYISATRIRGGQTLVDFLTPNHKVDIQTANFVIDDPGSSAGQALLTVNFRVKSMENAQIPALDIQTSISPKN